MASIITASTTGGIAIAADSSGIIQLNSDSTNAVTITTSGNVGIGGVTSPGQKLDVAGNISVTGSTISPNVFGGSSTGSTLTLQSTTGVGATDSIVFKVGNNGAVTAVTVASNGNVGIGTASAGTILDVNGTITCRASGGEGGEIYLNNPDNASIGLFVDVSAADNGRIYQIRNNSTLQIGQLIGTGGVITFNTAASERLRIAADGTITAGGQFLSTGAAGGIGYGTGAGGTVTQLTSKATGVTLNEPTGRITLVNSALAAATTVSFVLTNSAIAATDLLVLNHTGTGTVGAYALNAQCAAGSATINVRNVTAGSLSEAIVIGFAVIKAVTA